MLILGCDDAGAKLVTTLEAQLRIDPIKRYRMLEYVAAARRDHRCAGLQIMFSPDPEVIEKTRKSFDEEAHFCPILLGPASIPKLVDVEAALARPVLAMLAAIVHVREPEGPAILAALVDSWWLREDQAWHEDARILWSCIPENIMNTLNIPIRLEHRESDVWDDDDDDGEPGAWERGTGLWQRALRAGREEGRLDTLRATLALVLAARGREPTPEERSAIAVASADELEQRLREAL